VFSSLLELAEAEDAEVGTIAGTAWVIHFILTFVFSFTGRPFRADLSWGRRRV
jgi:hypothetical protein